MRAILALDGSPSSRAASELAATLAWPAASVIDVVGVVGSATESGPPRRQLELMLDEAAASLQHGSRVVRRTTLVGRAASLVVDLAGDLRAQLVMVGSRGHGPLRSMLLGSVSAEVVDHAPCPVLVVRHPTAESCLVAVDGSASAEGAITYLLANRILAGRPMEVLSVAPGPGGPAEPVSPGLGGDRGRADATAAAAAERLGARGYAVRWSSASGDAAHEIIEAAVAFRSDLIVLGSRGRTGLTRLMLGSVARNVLLHTGSSVLIVREPVRLAAREAVAAPARADQAEVIPA